MVPRRPARGMYDSISTKTGRGAVLDPSLGRVTGFLLGPCVPWRTCCVHWTGLLLQAVRTTSAPFLTPHDQPQGDSYCHVSPHRSDPHQCGHTCSSKPNSFFLLDSAVRTAKLSLPSRAENHGLYSSSLSKDADCRTFFLHFLPLKF